MFARPTEVIHLKIQIPDQSTILIKINSSENIWTVKEQLYEKIKLPPNQQILIYEGRELQDNFSLAFHKLKKLSTIRLITKIIHRPTTKAQELFQRFIDSVSRLPECEDEEFDQCINEITELLNNPILIGAARINRFMSQTIEDGKLIAETVERPLSRKTLDFIAQSQDLQITRLEQFASPARIYDLMEEEEEPDEFQMCPQELPSCIIQQGSVPEAALPNPWRMETARPFPRSFFINSDELKQIFAMQLYTLKKMGFTNEEAIVHALSETGGNVQLAAQLLQHKTSQL